jgi:hypothetical protein
MIGSTIIRKNIDTTATMALLTIIPFENIDSRVFLSLRAREKAEKYNLFKMNSSIVGNPAIVHAILTIPLCEIPNSSPIMIGDMASFPKLMNVES